MNIVAVDHVVSQIFHSQLAPAQQANAFWKAPTVGYSLGHRTSKASAYGPPSTLTFIFLWPPPCPWAISDVWLGNRELGLGRTRHEERAT